MILEESVLQPSSPTARACKALRARCCVLLHTCMHAHTVCSDAGKAVYCLCSRYLHRERSHDLRVTVSRVRVRVRVRVSYVAAPPARLVTEAPLSDIRLCLWCLVSARRAPRDTPATAPAPALRLSTQRRSIDCLAILASILQSRRRSCLVGRPPRGTCAETELITI